MKLSLRRVSALALAISALAACGKSPNEALCAKGNDCGLLQGKTEEQCVADADKTTTSLRDDSGCKEVADKYDAFVECSASLSCADLKNGNIQVQCKQQFADVVAAALVDAKTCKAAPTVSVGATAGAGATTGAIMNSAGAGGAGGSM